MTEISLPHNGWRPRPKQLPMWSYMEKGGRHAELIWHRRFGKDEVCLHWAAIAAHQRVAGYWHMLPMAAQARKAIWDAVNPHTGKRRIDEAFPHELRETTLNNEMMIKFKIGSTWQVVGSDNFNSLVGSPPAGIVYSEWALANPMSRAILRPIIKENNGWQLFITTPRGKNHAYTTFEAAKRDPEAFAQKLTIQDTGVFSAGEMERERQSYIADFGEDAGDALFRQEYLCDWDAAILGAYYGIEMRRALDEGRITDVAYDPSLKVNTAWDIGYTDDLVIWFYQVHRGEIRLIDYYSASGKDPEEVAKIVLAKPYDYDQHWLPWDAIPKTFASGGRSTIEQLWALGIKAKIVPNLSVQDGVQAVRHMLPRCYFDETNCSTGIECLRQYQREYDPDRRIFKDKPLHNWASHGADAFRMLALAWREHSEPVKPPAPKFFNNLTANEVFWPEPKVHEYERI